MGAKKSQYTQGRDDGLVEGIKQGRVELIDWLEHKYLHAPDRPDRGSPQGDALIQLAREAAEEFRNKEVKIDGK